MLKRHMGRNHPQHWDKVQRWLADVDAKLAVCAAVAADGLKGPDGQATTPSRE